MGIKKWKRENFSRLMRHLWQGSDWLLQYGLRVATTLGEKHEKSWNGLKSVITLYRQSGQTTPVRTDLTSIFDLLIHLR